MHEHALLQPPRAIPCRSSALCLRATCLRATQLWAKLFRPQPPPRPKAPTTLTVQSVPEWRHHPPDKYTPTSASLSLCGKNDGTVLRFPNQLFLPDPGSPNTVCTACASPLSPRRISSEPTNLWGNVETPVNLSPAAVYQDGNTCPTYPASDCGSASYQLGLSMCSTRDKGPSATKSADPVFSSVNGNI